MDKIAAEAATVATGVGALACVVLGAIIYVAEAVAPLAAAPVAVVGMWTTIYTVGVVT